MRSGVPHLGPYLGPYLGHSSPSRFRCGTCRHVVVGTWQGCPRLECRAVLGRPACVPLAGATALTGATADSEPAARAPAGCGTTQAPTAGAAAASSTRISGRPPARTGAPLPGVTPEAAKGFPVLAAGLAYRPGIGRCPAPHGLQPGACPPVPAMPLMAACRAAPSCQVRQRCSVIAQPRHSGVCRLRRRRGAPLCASVQSTDRCTARPPCKCTWRWPVPQCMVCSQMLHPGGRPCSWALPLASAVCEGVVWAVLAGPTFF